MPATSKALQQGEERQMRAPEVIRLVSEGKPLVEALQAAGLSQQQFHYALSKERELSVQYIRAQEIRADIMADEVTSIADNPDIDPVRARNMIEARKWRTKTLNPKTYGERIDLNVTQTIDVLGTLSEARARLLRPMSDQEDNVIDVTPIKSTACDAQPPDDVSVAPASGVPDIFD